MTRTVYRKTTTEKKGSDKTCNVKTKIQGITKFLPCQPDISYKSWSGNDYGTPCTFSEWKIYGAKRPLLITMPDRVCTFIILFILMLNSTKPIAPRITLLNKVFYSIAYNKYYVPRRIRRLFAKCTNRFLLNLFMYTLAKNENWCFLIPAKDTQFNPRILEATNLRGDIKKW